MRKRIAILLCLSFLLVACGDDDGGNGTVNGGDNGENGSGGNGGDASGLPDVIRVGVPLDTSGAAGIAGVGTSERDGVRLAAQEINETGFLGDTRIELIEIDTRAESQQAVSAALDLVSDEVDAVVGFTLTPSFLAAGSILQDNGIPTMAVGLSAPGVIEVGDYIFRMYPDMSSVIPPGDVRFIEAIGDVETAAVIFQADAEAAVNINEQRVAAIEDMGVEIVARETFSGDDTDVRAQITNIINARPDVVLATPLPGMMSTVYIQFEEMGLDVPVIAAPDVSDDILDRAGEAMQCYVYTSAWNSRSEAGNNPHFVEYWEENGADRTPTVFEAAGYASLWAIAEGFKAADSTDGAAVRDAMTTLSAIQSPFGEIGFNESRAASVEGTPLQIRDMELVVWDPEEPCER